MHGTLILTVVLSLMVAPLIGPGVALAALFESSSFQIVDPVMNSAGGFSSSDSFRLHGGIIQLAPGFSESASFQVKGGGFSFPAPSAAAAAVGAVVAAATPTGGGPYLDIFKKLIDKIIALIAPCSSADLNCDGRVDISDAGILFYWWDKDITRPEFANLVTSFLGRKRSSPDFNKDGRVDIFDLSILLARWTG
jgi:hypothetical protein